MTPRQLPAADRHRFEDYLREIFAAVGMDLDTPGTRSTPRRFVGALFEATDGYDGDPKLLTAFPTECHGGANCELAQIVEGPIPFFALCEHHALPFFGHAWRGVRRPRADHRHQQAHAARPRRDPPVRRPGADDARRSPTSCERLMDAHGVAVYLEADHLCTQMRGVREEMTVTRTTAYRGAYAERSGAAARVL